MSTLVEHRVRIRTADNTADAVVITSVRGASAPYLKDPPKGDGASFDPVSGQSMVAAYTGTIADWPIGSMQRAVTSTLEDAGGRQQLGYRRAFVEYRQDGGPWNVLVAGVLTLLRLMDAMTWEYTVNDFARAQRGTQVFGALGSTSMLSFLATWPSRGCIFGGPFTGPFALAKGFRDLGGWQMRVNRAGVNPEYRYYLEPVVVYGPPNWVVGPQPKLTEFADAINQAAAGLQQLTSAPILGAPFTTIEDAQLNTWWNGLIYLIDGVPYRPTTSGPYSGLFFNNDDPNQMVSTLKGKLGVFCTSDGQTPLVPGAIVSVRCLTILPSDLSPIYFDDHPIELLKTLWTAVGIPFDATACDALKSDPAIGTSARIALRITQAKELNALVQNAVCLPYGIGIRSDSQGRLVPFRSRVFANTPPSLTITAADVVDGTTSLPFELDTSAGLNLITVTQKNLQPTPTAGAQVATLDGVTESDSVVSLVNGDTTALPFGTLDISIPGMMHTSNSGDPLGEPQFKALGAEFFDRFGHGSVALETTFRRGGVGAPLDNDAAFPGPLLGDEVLVQLPQLPNHNYRLGDNPAIAARAMQIVRLTEMPSGRGVRLVDSGPNAQPLPTVPTLSIVATTDLPRTTAQVTVTNAAALNALGYAARIQWVIDTGATPAAGDYHQALYFAAGTIPTAAVRLPGAVAGSTVWVQGRSEKAGARPSNYGTAVSVHLTVIDNPTSVTATPSGTDGSMCVLSWTPGANAGSDITDVWLRTTGQAFSLAVKQGTVVAGSTRFTLERLVPGAYTASVQHRDPRSNDVSEPVDVSFVAFGGSVVLDAPTDANGFSGSQDKRYGFPQQDGIYGLAVAATEFPGFTEFAEEIETARNSGVYDSPQTVGRVSNVQGDWTIYESVAPNDGRRRVLSARHVRDGATSSAYTTGVVVSPWTSQPLGLFSKTAGADGILRVSSTESPNGAARIFTVIVGALVDSLHVHFRTVPIDTVGDVFDFSEDSDIGDDPNLKILPAPADGSPITFTIAHPSRAFHVAGRMVPYTAPPSLKEGINWPFGVDAAPQAVNAKLHPARVGAIGSLSIDVAFGVSDGPVVLDVIEDSLTTSSTILTKTLSAPATLDATSDPVLGGRALPPGKDSLAWRVRITDVSGQPYWFGPASANRDPLPNGTPEIKNFRANPIFECPFDPDTDQIRYTSHSGKVRTLNGAALLAAGSPIAITVAVDPFDDATTEPALVVDERRTGAAIDYQGGGQWVTMWQGDLHGQPSNPPTADIRTVPNSDRDAEDVFVTPDTQVDEQLFVFYREGDTNTAPEWVACVSAGDRTPFAVTAGTVIGPSNFFARTDGSLSPTAKLAAISLARDQIVTHGIMIEGVDSGIQSPWLDVVLSLMEQPWNESVDLRFDPATNELAVYIVAGAHCASEGVLFADNDGFSAPITASGNVADGNTLKLSTTLSDAQLGKPWYVQVTPFNAVSLGGLPGAPQKATVIVPAIIGDPQIAVVESGGNATITVVIDDPGSYLDTAWTNGVIAGAIHFDILKLGVRTIEAATSHTLVGTLHTWTKVIALDPLHIIPVSIFAHLIDGSTTLVFSSGIDSNKISDVVNATVANAGTTATLTIQWDTDAAIGTGNARYTLDNGAHFTTGDISSGLLTQFAITRLATKQTAIVQAKNVFDGNWGNQTTVEIDALEASNAISQGTVSIDADGNYGFTIDLPSTVVSFKWLASTGGFPTDASVSSSGAIVTPSAGVHTATVNSIGTLTLGQTIDISFLMFAAGSGTGAVLHTLHIRGSYLNLTASKTINFSAASYTQIDPPLGSTTDNVTFDSNTLPNSPILGIGTPLKLAMHHLLPTGVTITSVSMWGAFGSQAGGNVGGWVNRFLRQASGGSTTQLGSGSLTYNGGLQTSTLTMSETVGSTSGYTSRIDWSGAMDAGQAIAGGVAITYSMPDSKKTL